MQKKWKGISPLEMTMVFKIQTNLRKGANLTQVQIDDM